MRLVGERGRAKAISAVEAFLRCQNYGCKEIFASEMVSAYLTYFSSRFSVVLKTSKVRRRISNDLAEKTVALSRSWI